MKLYQMLVLNCLVLAACNSEGDGTMPKFAPSNIKGVAAMGELVSGTVTVYDFSQCKKGEVLGRAELRDENNLYNIVAQPNALELPVLLELSNFKYREEADGAQVDASDKVLYSSFMLRAGVNQNATVSYWTHLAHARTVYKCQDAPAAASQHIAESNQMFKNALAFDPIEVLPEVIVTDSLIINEIDTVKYGVANAAVSYYTYKLDSLDGAATFHVDHNSITLAGIAYDDLIHDGFLNGVDKLGQLYMGAVEVARDTYQTDIPNKIDYVLAIIDFLPFEQNPQIAIVADAFNESDMDIFTGKAAAPLGDISAPAFGSITASSCNVVSGGGADFEILMDEPDSTYTVDVMLENTDCSIYSGNVENNIPTLCGEVAALNGPIKPNAGPGQGARFVLTPGKGNSGPVIYSSGANFSVIATNSAGLTLKFKIWMLPNCTFYNFQKI